jgi:hypothetical protein
VEIEQHGHTPEAAGLSRAVFEPHPFARLAGIVDVLPGELASTL